MLFVESLGRREGAPSGEAEARVRVALERGEVIEHRRLVDVLALLELRDRPGLVATRLHDREGLGLGCDARLRARVEATLVAAVAVRGRFEGGVDQPVGLGLESADLLLATREDRERRRLHAAQRDGAVEG